MAAFDKSISCRLAPAPGEGQRARTVTHARIANLFCHAVHPAGWFAPECVLRLVLVCSGANHRHEITLDLEGDHFQDSPLRHLLPSDLTTQLIAVLESG